MVESLILATIILMIMMISLIAGVLYYKSNNQSHPVNNNSKMHGSMLHLAVGIVIAGSYIAALAILSSQAKLTYAVEGAIPTNPLPFNLANVSSLRSSSKKVFAHYFPAFPISFDNKTSSSDYYATQYLTINGENGKHAAYGGFLRDRPLPRAVDTSPNWQVNDMKVEVQRAIAAGLDGFTVDILGIEGAGWTRTTTLIQAAAEVDSGFKIVLMPDAASLASIDASTLASKIASIANASSVYHLTDERLVVSPFYPEKQTAAYWSNFISVMKNTYGIEVAFVPCFLNYAGNVDAYAPFSYGFSNWGSRNTATNINLNKNINDAHSKGKIWMQPVSFQDVRPRSSVYDEAGNTENLRTTWTAAQSGADWVQLTTWNDYSETTEFAPSLNSGYVPLDLSSYYLTGFKNGITPMVARDVIYISHRVQPYEIASPSQPNRMSLRAGSTPARNTVEFLTYLTAASTITAKVGATTYIYSAPAGVYAKTYPLADGLIYGSVSRNGNILTDVTTKAPIVSSRPTQDLGYYAVSSGREGKVYTQPSSQTPTPVVTPPAPVTNPISHGGDFTTPSHTVTSTTGQKIQIVANGSTVDKNATIALDDTKITDKVVVESIDKVEFYVDSKLLQTVTTAPYVFDTKKIIKPGIYTITQRTYYKNGTKDEITKMIKVINTKAVEGVVAKPEVTKTLIFTDMYIAAAVGLLGCVLGLGFIVWWFTFHIKGRSLTLTLLSFVKNKYNWI
jgi:glycosyl hydrolase family 71/Big-like domain-containing protein